MSMTSSSSVSLETKLMGIQNFLRINLKESKRVEKNRKDRKSKKAASIDGDAGSGDDSPEVDYSESERTFAALMATSVRGRHTTLKRCSSAGDVLTPETKRHGQSGNDHYDELAEFRQEVSTYVSSAPNRSRSVPKRGPTGQTPESSQAKTVHSGCSSKSSSKVSIETAAFIRSGLCRAPYNQAKSATELAAPVSSDKVRQSRLPTPSRVVRTTSLSTTGGTTPLTPTTAREKTPVTQRKPPVPKFRRDSPSRASVDLSMGSEVPVPYRRKAPTPTFPRPISCSTTVSTTSAANSPCSTPCSTPGRSRSTRPPTPSSPRSERTPTPSSPRSRTPSSWNAYSSTTTSSSYNSSSNTNSASNSRSSSSSSSRSIITSRSNSIAISEKSASDNVYACPQSELHSLSCQILSSLNMDMNIPISYSSRSRDMNISTTPTSYSSRARSRSRSNSSSSSSSSRSSSSSSGGGGGSSSSSSSSSSSTVGARSTTPRAKVPLSPRAQSAGPDLRRVSTSDSLYGDRLYGERSDRDDHEREREEKKPSVRGPPSPCVLRPSIGSSRYGTGNRGDREKENSYNSHQNHSYNSSAKAVSSNESQAVVLKGVSVSPSTRPSLVSAGVVTTGSANRHVHSKSLNAETLVSSAMNAHTRWVALRGSATPLFTMDLQKQPMDDEVVARSAVLAYIRGPKDSERQIIIPRRKLHPDVVQNGMLVSSSEYKLPADHPVTMPPRVDTTASQIAEYYSDKWPSVGAIGRRIISMDELDVEDDDTFAGTYDLSLLASNSSDMNDDVRDGEVLTLVAAPTRMRTALLSI